MFQSGTGEHVNADVNAQMNIERKNLHKENIDESEYLDVIIDNIEKIQHPKKIKLNKYSLNETKRYKLNSVNNIDKLKEIIKEYVPRIKCRCPRKKSISLYESKTVCNLV